MFDDPAVSHAFSALISELQGKGLLKGFSSIEDIISKVRREGITSFQKNLKKDEKDRSERSRVEHKIWNGFREHYKRDRQIQGVHGNASWEVVILDESLRDLGGAWRLPEVPKVDFVCLWFRSEEKLSNYLLGLKEGSENLHLYFAHVDLSFRLTPTEIFQVVDRARKNKLDELGILPKKAFIETFRQLALRRFLGLRIQFK